MDTQQRRALDSAIRRAVAPDIDELAGELLRLRRDVVALRLAAGLPARRELDRTERQARAAELREAGHSTRAIAAALGADRNTITKDLAQMGVPRPPAILGLDGRLTAGPPPAA